jgi:hypothetical protein
MKTGIGPVRVDGVPCRLFVSVSYMERPHIAAALYESNDRALVTRTT